CGRRGHPPPRRRLRREPPGAATAERRRAGLVDPGLVAVRDLGLLGRSPQGRDPPMVMPSNTFTETGTMRSIVVIAVSVLGLAAPVAQTPAPYDVLIA